MNPIHRIRRSLTILAGLAGALLASAAAASAASATLEPLPGPGGSTLPPGYVIITGGMPGWQIALIAAGAALVAAAVAVLLDRARLGAARDRNGLLTGHRTGPEKSRHQPGRPAEAAGAYLVAPVRPDQGGGL
jgi:hypothetical protein